MRAPSRSLLAGLCFLLPAIPAHADVADYIGKTVGSVRLEVEGRPAADDDLFRLIETRAGAPLSLRAVRESIAHLASLGRFESVAVDATLEAGRVLLRYELTPVHPIEQVVFTGETSGGGIDQGDLRRALADRFGESVPVARAPEMADAVAAALRVRGYQRARVGVKLETRHAPDRSILFLLVEAGERTRVAAIDVVGANAPVAEDLVDHIGIGAGDPYEPDAIAARIEEWVAERRREGYFENRVTLTARFDDLDRRVALTLTVVQGPRVRVAFAGDPLPSGVRDRLAPITMEGSIDEDLLEDSTNRIEEYLRERGYRNAMAPYTRESSDGAVSVTFTVQQGALYRVASVEVEGNNSIPLEEITKGLRIRTGQPFVESLLDADQSAIERQYEQSGFTSVVVEAAGLPLTDTPGADGQIAVAVRFTITENVQTTIQSVRIESDASLPTDTLLADLGVQRGGPLRLAQLAVDRDAIQLYFVDRGYRHASVTSSPGIGADGSLADVVFAVRAGPRIVVDHVLIVGNTRTRTETIERELQLGPGDPFGQAAVLESQQRLATLGLFRRVRIVDLSHGDETRRDLLVSVEEAPATTIGYGGGLEVSPRTGTEPDDGGAVERLEFRPRAFFEIGRRNLFGKNRSISLFTRVSLRSDEGPTREDGSRFGFSEYRVLGTFREPRVLQTLADAFLTGTAEQQIRPSFKFARRAFSAEVARAITRTMGLSGNYQIQRTEIFDEEFNPEQTLLIDRLFPQVRLSSFSVSAVGDTRDDQLSPRSGRYASVNTQVAGRRIGSEVGFVRSFLTAQMFRQVPRSRGVVLAASARVGLATGFPREVTRRDDDGMPIVGPDGEIIVDVVEDLPASERFFAGGDTTVRGFALDQLGTEATIDQAGFPLGGNALAIFNVELRVPVAGGLGVVGFYDVGNVFARTSDLDISELRGAVGVGVRYASPVGPLRVDLGFKTDRREITGGRRENLTALHISLGQAF